MCPTFILIIQETQAEPCAACSAVAAKDLEQFMHLKEEHLEQLDFRVHHFHGCSCSVLEGFHLIKYSTELTALSLALLG